VTEIITVYYLLLKKHNKTGLKYLCQTTKKEPDKYKGSGKRWRHHIKKHGYDCQTTILGKFEKKEELVKKGKYYSSLWNVVDSNDFANLRIEEGDGGDTSNFIDYKAMKPMPTGKWKRPDLTKYNETRINPVIVWIDCPWCGEKGYGEDFFQKHIGSKKKDKKYYSCASNPRNLHPNSKLYLINGEELSVKEISAKYSLPITTINNRLYQKWDWDKIINTPLQETQKYKIFSKDLTIPEIAEIYSEILSKTMVYTCLENNFPLEDFITQLEILYSVGIIKCPHCNQSGNTSVWIYLHFSKCRELTNIKHANEKTFDYDGEQLTLREISKKTGIPKKTLRTRIRKMSLERAISLKESRKEKKHLVDGNYYQTTTLLKEFNITSTSLYRNLKKGLSAQEIVNKFRN
tara:strand:+ start:269 stop:1480 length:1212 start_codon:yes stop_codon:yes gene_type:complete